jgi:hypothetical protein
MCELSPASTLFAKINRSYFVNSPHTYFGDLHEDGGNVKVDITEIGLQGIMDWI